MNQIKKISDFLFEKITSPVFHLENTFSNSSFTNKELIEGFENLSLKYNFLIVVFCVLSIFFSICIFWLSIKSKPTTNTRNRSQIYQNFIL